jgi:flagellar basal body rod protein FlgC
MLQKRLMEQMENIISITGRYEANTTALKTAKDMALKQWR